MRMLGIKFRNELLNKSGLQPGLIMPKNKGLSPRRNRRSPRKKTGYRPKPQGLDIEKETHLFILPQNHCPIQPAE